MSGIWPARRAVWLCLAVVFIAPGSTLAAPERVRVPKPRPVQAGDLPVAQVDGKAAVGLARMPRARPDIEPKTGVAKWAKGAAAHFDEAAFADPVPAATQAILAARTTPGAASVTASPNNAPRSPHALDAIDIVAPLPRSRPDDTKPELALMMPPPVMPQEPELIAPEDAGCVTRLRALGAQFTEAPPMNVGGACSVPQPLKVSSLGSGVSIGPETLLNCAEAEALALWMKEVVVPAGRKLLGASPTRITQDSAYVCRTRYNDPHEKISEHAHANAIDIASFGFDHRAAVDIGRNVADSAEAKFEAEIREGSCNYFTTVLGPGSNAAHATHFHLDLAYRRHGYRLCELGAPIAVSAPAKTTRE